MLGSRKLRIATAIFVLVAVFQLLWPSATGFVSTFAVVNAPVVTVRAPINGRIVMATNGISSPVTRQKVLLDIEKTFDAAPDIARLDGQILSTQVKIAALQAEEAALETTISTLRARADIERGIEVRFLNAKLDEARALRRMRVNQRQRSESEKARLETLAERGAVTREKLVTATFALESLAAQVAVQDATISALEIELEAISNSFPSPAGTGRRAEGFDRIDDMLRTLADVRTRRRSAQGDLSGWQTHREILVSDQQNTDRFRPVSRTNGVVWTASAAAGSSITLGSDIMQVLDCERRFLEVVFSERAFESIPAGTLAEVQLRGSTDVFHARVISRHAEALGSAQSAVDAAVLEPHENGGVKVFVALDPTDTTDPAVSAAFCDVGRTAEVQISDPRVSDFLAPLENWISRLRKASGIDVAFAKLSGGPG